MTGLILPLEKAMLIIEKEGGDKTVPVLFNPEQYSISRSVNYPKTKIPGKNNPTLQNMGGKQKTLRLSLYFDSTNPYIRAGTENDVSVLISPILDTVSIDGNLHAPPKVTFRWGSFSFRGVVLNMTQTYTMFLPSGMPVRAKVDLTLEYAANDQLENKSNPKFSPDRTKVRVLEDDGGLWRLSNAEYGDAGHWRKIADTNNIHNPRKCPAGTVLKIPPL